MKYERSSGYGQMVNFFILFRASARARWSGELMMESQQAEWSDF